jgi:hypothetical protein
MVETSSDQMIEQATSEFTFPFPRFTVYFETNAKPQVLGVPRGYSLLILKRN